MKKSYYDRQTGEYVDITANRRYIRTGICELTGERTFTHFHHKLPQSKCMQDLNAKKVRYPSTWTQEFINENQRVFELSPQAHLDVHSLSNDKFLKKYGRERSEFIYLED